VTDDVRYVRGFDELGIADIPVAGGKGAGLGELMRAGVQVPPGCVVTTEAYHRVVDVLDPDGSLRHAIGELDRADPAGVAAATTQLRQMIMAAPLPGDVEAAIREGYARIPGRPGEEPAVAVRSSATSEDGADASFAGLQDTFLWVTGADAVAEHVRRCWASLYSVGSVSYRLRKRVGEDGLAMAVVVQRMVDARSSGVMFTRSPLTGDRSVVFVEASWGLGSAVVGGEVTPDNWVVDKITGDVVRSTVSTKVRRHRADPVARTVVDEEVPEGLRNVPALSVGELKALVDVGLAVERHYGTPQDIEWAIAGSPAGDATDATAGEAVRGTADGAAPGGGLFLLQSRPETVWAAREPAPVAAPAARPLDHVASLMAGRADRGAGAGTDPGAGAGTVPGAGAGAGRS
jgi:pyruvate,water dikinase